MRKVYTSLKITAQGIYLTSSFTEQQWHLGVDVIVTDSTSEHFGFVGSIVRIIKKDKVIRISVNFDGNVFGFEKDDIQIATL